MTTTDQMTQVQPMVNNDALCKLFVGNVNKSTSEEEFKKYFEKYGKMREVILLKDQANQVQNRGFGFVTPESVGVTDQILLEPGHQLDGRDLDVKRAFPKEIDDPLVHTRTPRIFLGGLPHNLSEEEIINFFNEKYGNFGKVKEVVIKKERQTGRPRGFCFVSFENTHVVDKILIEMRYPIINNKRCEVKKADPGIPITGVPPSQMAKMPSRGGQPSPTHHYGGHQRMPYSRPNPSNGGTSSQQMSSNPPPVNTGMSSVGQNCAYDYSPYSGNNSGMVGYPQSSAYYGYYQNQGSSGQYNEQGGYPPYGYSDQRGMRNNYQRSVNSQNISRGRPY